MFNTTTYCLLLLVLVEVVGPRRSISRLLIGAFGCTRVQVAQVPSTVLVRCKSDSRGDQILRPVITKFVEVNFYADVDADNLINSEFHAFVREEQRKISH